MAQRGGDPPRYVTIGGALVTFKHLSHSYAGKLPHREIFQFVGNSLDRNMIYILQLEQAASSADKVKEWKGECEFMIKPALVAFGCLWLLLVTFQYLSISFLVFFF